MKTLPNTSLTFLILDLRSRNDHVSGSVAFWFKNRKTEKGVAGE
jgi:hypothetical protein